MKYAVETPEMRVTLHLDSESLASAVAQTLANTVRRSCEVVTYSDHYEPLHRQIVQPEPGNDTAMRAYVEALDEIDQSLHRIKNWHANKHEATSADTRAAGIVITVAEALKQIARYLV